MLYSSEDLTIASAIGSKSCFGFAREIEMRDPENEEMAKIGRGTRKKVVTRTKGNARGHEGWCIRKAELGIAFYIAVR